MLIGDTRITGSAVVVVVVGVGVSLCSWQLIDPCPLELLLGNRFVGT